MPYLNFNSLLVAAFGAPIGAPVQFQEFVLPINPQALQVSIPFATSLAATTGGIVEESNGVVFRTIQITGTLGVAGRKVTGQANFPTTRDLRTVSPGTRGIQATLDGAALGQLLTLPTLSSGIAQADESFLGHAQVNDLLNYFVAYTELKKTVAGKQARLLFINRKDGVIYVVTPISFDTSKSAQDPHLTQYRIALRAWDITSPLGAASFGGILDTITNATAAAMTAVGDVLTASRSAFCAAQGVLRGVVSDYDTTTKTINQAILLAKGASKAQVTMADLDGPTGLLSQMGNQLTGALQAAGATATQLRTNVAPATNPSRLFSTTASTGANNTNAQLQAQTNPLLTPEQRCGLVDVLNNISPASVSFTQAQLAIVNAALVSAQNTTIAQLDTMRAQFESARDALEDSIGLSDPTADAAAGRVPAPQTRDPDPSDYLTLASINDLVASIDALGATRNVASVPPISPFVTATNAANNPDVTVGDYTSSFLIPFPFEGTLEQLATQYLGGPDAWIDIAVANQLQPPYVDEVGFTLALVGNGNGNSIIIASSANLCVGQTVYLSSSSQSKQSRVITGITQLPSGTVLVQLNGPADLNNFTVAQGATLMAYLPNTVNHLNTILIPTNSVTPGAAVPNTRTIPLFSTQNPQQKSMGIDLLLDANYNIVLDSTGDISLAAGLANAVQAISLKLSVEKGVLLQHTDFGLGIPIGTRQITDDSVRQSIENAILGDDRFTAIQTLTVTFTGDVVTIGMTVSVAGGGSIPLTFTLQ